MGDHILMRNLLITVVAFTTPCLLMAEVSSSHTLINKQIQEIKPPREGVSPTAVSSTKNPFLMFHVNKKGKKVTYAVKKRVKLTPLKLESIINKNAKINGKWYKEGDRIRNYTIKKVSSGTVLLKSRNKEMKLYQNTKNDKINFNVN